MAGGKYKKDFVALAAPSGGGKTTLCNMLLKKYPDTCVSVSYTTRAPRGAEKNGVEYHFVSEDEFKRRIDADGFAEWAKVHGHYYGTSKEFLATKAREGKVVLLDIDVQGVDQIKKHFPDRTLSIFILPPSLEDLEKRLRDRKTESEEKIRQRLEAARVEMAAADRFDHKIVNRDLEKSFAELRRIMKGDVGLAD